MKFIDLIITCTIEILEYNACRACTSVLLSFATVYEGFLAPFPLLTVTMSTITLIFLEKHAILETDPNTLVIKTMIFSLLMSVTFGTGVAACSYAHSTTINFIVFRLEGKTITISGLCCFH